MSPRPKQTRAARPVITERWVVVEIGTSVHRGVSDYAGEAEAKAECDRLNGRASGDERYTVEMREEQRPR